MSAAAARSDGGEAHQSSERRFLTALARAFGGGIFFALPLFMTMEMWWLGFYMDRTRLAIFLVLMIPLLIALSYFSGFQETPRRRDAVRDGFVALFVGYLTSTAVCGLLALLEPGMPTHELLGKITLLAVPSSFGAAIASSQLSNQSAEGNKGKKETGYGVEMFYMAAGAIFFAFNVAPTEEMILIAFKMTPWHAVAAVLVTVGLMHAFVYVVEFRGQETMPKGSSLWSIFLRYTLVGFALSLVVSAYVLWTFGRVEGSGAMFILMATIVLAFPAGLGAAAARLVF